MSKEIEESDMHRKYNEIKEKIELPIISKLESSRITFSQDYSTFKVYIDSIVHIHIQKKSFQGYQSYKQEGTYYIEIYLNDKVKVLVGYDRKEVWKEVLETLDKNL